MATIEYELMAKTECVGSVLRLEWGEDKGKVFYREIWSNGVKTGVIFPGFRMDDLQFKRRKEELEAALVGQRR